MGTPIVNLKGIVDTSVAANVDIQATEAAKQVVLDAVVEAQDIVDSGSATITAHTNTKKIELDSYTNVKKIELTVHKDTAVDEFDTSVANTTQAYDANALNRISQYDANHSAKLIDYNTNNNLKITQYNANHVERLDDINYAYADRIVDMINTKKLVGVTDQFVAVEPTQYAMFLDTTGTSYAYYLNAILMVEGVDYVVISSQEIKIFVGINAHDVILQIDNTLLESLLISAGYVHTDTIGVANGIAGLDGNSQVPASQLPSYVDDVIEIATYAELPITGESDKIYIVVTDETSGNNTSSYRWTGTVYAMVSNTLTAEDVKALYESNADTNAFTDTEQTKVGNISVTQAVDLDVIESDTNLNNTHRISDGSDHIFIDQDVTTTGTPRFNSVQVNGGTGNQGLITWNVEDETLDLVVSSNVTYQIGQELGLNVRNISGSTINNGTVISVTGASGDKVTVDLADNTNENLAAATIALVTETITNNSTGKITTEGLVRGLDTSLLTEGASIWLGNNGSFVTVKPLAPSHLVHLGWVVRSHATEGSVYVKISNGWEIEELHDVLITDITTGEVLQWTGIYWENKALDISDINGLSSYLSTLQDNIDIITAIEEW